MKDISCVSPLLRNIAVECLTTYLYALLNIRLIRPCVTFLVVSLLQKGPDFVRFVFIVCREGSGRSSGKNTGTFFLRKEDCDDDVLTWHLNCVIGEVALLKRGNAETSCLRCSTTPVELPVLF